MLKMPNPFFPRNRILLHWQGTSNWLKQPAFRHDCCTSRGTVIGNWLTALAVLVLYRERDQNSDYDRLNWCGDWWDCFAWALNVIGFAVMYSSVSAELLPVIFGKPVGILLVSLPCGFYGRKLTKEWMDSNMDRWTTIGLEWPHWLYFLLGGVVGGLGGVLYYKCSTREEMRKRWFVGMLKFGALSIAMMAIYRLLVNESNYTDPKVYGLAGLILGVALFFEFPG